VQTAGVVEAKPTERADDAVAVTVNGTALRAWLPSPPKLIVWAALATVKVCVITGADPKLAFPAWLAVMEHVPAPAMVTVEPATVHTAVAFDAKVTVRPEEAVAETPNGAAPNVVLLSGPNVIDCEAGLTVKLCVTDVAEL
jgi:hypothetical protein